MISPERSFQLLYGGLDPKEKARYSIARAAHYLHMSSSTLRSWVRGRDYPVAGGMERWPPLIKAADLLSFNNLSEAYVLRALRVDHKLSMPAVREALDYAQRAFGIERLLLSSELQATPGNVFLKRFGQLINLNRSGQLAAEQLLKAVLQRVERNPDGAPIKMFPTTSYDVNALRHSPRLIVIDPEVSFGRPIVVAKGVRTVTITSRIDAGEDPADVAKDYALKQEELEAAISYERSAA